MAIANISRIEATGTVFNAVRGDSFEIRNMGGATILPPLSGNVMKITGGEILFIFPAYEEDNLKLRVSSESETDWHLDFDLEKVGQKVEIIYPVED